MEPPLPMGSFKSFEQLSSGLSPDQRKILNAIYRYREENGKWPLTRRIHHDFGKTTVMSALKSLGGMVAREAFDSGNQRYELTFLGVLLTDQGKDGEELIVRYLRFLQQKFDADPDLETFSSMEVKTALCLTDQETGLLGGLLYQSAFLGSSGISPTGWTARFPRDIDDLAGELDPRAYLRSKVMEKYDPTVPIDERGRALHSMIPVEDRELEQDFKILFSRNQAVQDFETWTTEIGATGQQIAVLFIDIDRFKALNSRHTEPTIDQTILPQAQRVLKNLVRHRGEAYRYGGDEFLVILPNHTAAEAMVFAERLRATFESCVFQVDKATENLTISGGIALWPEHGLGYQDVLQRASDAKRTAKTSRNTIKLADTKQDQSQPLLASGLAEHAQRLARLLSERSSTGLEYDPQMTPEEIATALELSEEEISLAADELDEKGWVELLKTSGMGKAGFAEISPKPQLFLETDSVLKGWNPREDAKILAATLVKLGDDSQADLETLAKTLSWEARRLNAAAHFLAINGYIQPIEVMGTHPYRYAALVITARTRRFAMEN